jgi:hypothetical protein
MPKRKAAVATRPNMLAVIRGVRPLKSGAFTATPAYKIQHFNSLSNFYSIPIQLTIIMGKFSDLSYS